MKGKQQPPRTEPQEDFGSLVPEEHSIQVNAPASDEELRAEVAQYGAMLRKAGVLLTRDGRVATFKSVPGPKASRAKRRVKR